MEIKKKIIYWEGTTSTWESQLGMANTKACFNKSFWL